MFAGKRAGRAWLLMFLFALGATAQQPRSFYPPQPGKTFCNPLNLNYRFMADAVDAREAADPVIVLFKGDYYLFASRSGGYWTSPDLRSWTLIIPTGIDIETYAPAVLVMRDSLFYIPSAVGQIYKTANPKSGAWVSGPTTNSYGDPALFLDDDGRLYMYYGLSNTTPTSVVELDPMTFREIGAPVNIVTAKASEHGWERRGDDNLLDERPWIEGSWMVKANNTYYLQYSAPGTEFKGYADGVYTADSPKGPFQYAPYSPVDFKPTGCISGGGHGNTFKDKNGLYWHIGTMTISVKHMFERRLALYPVAFDADGHMHTNTAFGDYPQYHPGEKENPVDENFAGMMLLSYKKRVMASSLMTDHPAGFAADEDARTYWSASSGGADEWMMMDLGQECDIEAVQINFAEEGTTPGLVRGRNQPLYEQYILEGSNDGMNWGLLIDKSANTQDVPHDYIELAQAAKARYVRLKNVFTPGNGKFAVRDLRIFGNSTKAVIQDVTGFTVTRDAADGRNAVVRWSPVDHADGYIVRYGIAPDKLYNNYMVYDADSVAIHSLNKNVEYSFSVQSFDGGTEVYSPIGEFKSYQSGDWADANTWGRFDGTAWVHPAPNAPRIADGPVTVSTGHAVTMAVSDSADQLTVEPSATLIINPGATFKVVDGIGADAAVAGTLRNQGTVDIAPSATLSFVDGGVYIHDQDAGSIPSAEWRSGSTCQIEGIVGTVPENGNQNFHHVVWNCVNQSGNLSLKWDGNTIGGNITILSTGSGRWQMCSPSEGSSVHVTIHGDVIQSGGAFTTNGTGKGNTSVAIAHTGDIDVTGGNFSISRGSQGGTGTAVWAIDGDVSISHAATQNSNPTGGKLVFTGTEPHTLTLGEGNTLTAFPVEVDSGATLNVGTSELSGSGVFILNHGANLVSGHPDGIDGNLKNTGDRTLGAGAGYGFNGDVSQVTGTLMPDTVGSLILDNGAGIVLSKSVTVQGVLEIRKPGFSRGAFQLVYGPGSTLKYSGSTAMNTSDVEFPEDGGPENLIIDNSASNGITLHAKRTIPGNLHLSGRFRLAGFDFTADKADHDSTANFVVTNGAGSFYLSTVGAAETLFPVGTFSYAPIWIANAGTVDRIGVRVDSDSKALPEGGRIRCKWTLSEGTPGGGDYTLTFGWLSQLEDAKFKLDRAGNAGIFFLSSDTVEAGAGVYATQFDSSPYTVSRGGITTLGTFSVGKFGTITAVGEPKKSPTGLNLSQNYPNPFNPSTKISFVTPQDGHISLKVFDILGKEIATIVDRTLESGEHRYEWNASDFASGIYFYRIMAGDFVQTRKMMLLK